jgi:hypothetical protein
VRLCGERVRVCLELLGALTILGANLIAIIILNLSYEMNSLIGPVCAVK